MTVQWFENIEDYILKNKLERQKHLDLKIECIEIGGADSRHYRGLLAHYLNTTIPSGHKINLCHACNNHKCSNVKHLYWGTGLENSSDAIACGAINGEKIKQSLIKKYGSEEAWKKQLSKNGKKGGLKSIALGYGFENTKQLTEKEIQRRLDLIKTIDLTKFGWVQKVSNVLNISHTQVRKFVQKHYKGKYFKRKNGN